MMKNKSFGAVAFGVVCLVTSGNAAAAPVDNPGLAVFSWYNNYGADFVHFASGEDVSSLAVTGANGPYFGAYVLGDGTMSSFVGSYAPEHATALGLGGTINFMLHISGVTGVTDCSAGGGDCEVDWQVTATMEFTGGMLGSSPTDCVTDPFVAHVASRFAGGTPAYTFVNPALSGSGNQFCSGLSAFINLWFDLGSDGATLGMYKFKGSNVASASYLTGSP